VLLLYLLTFPFRKQVYMQFAILGWTVKPRSHDTTCCESGLTTGCIVYTAGCQTGCTTRFDNRLNEHWLFVQNGCHTGMTTGLTTASRVQYISDLHSKFALRPHHVWKYGRHPVCDR